MASLGVNSITQTSANLYVAELNTTTTYKSVYISCNGYTSPNLAKSTASSTSNGWNVTGLSCGNYYTATWNIESAGGSTASGSGGFSTSSCPLTVGAVTNLSTTTSSITGGKIDVSWSSATNATSYGVELYNGSSTSSFNQSTSTTGTTSVFTGLNEGTTYTVKVFGRRDGSSNGTPATSTITTTSFNVGSISTLSLVSSTQTSGKVDADWSDATNATSYGAEIYRGNSTSSSDLVQSFSPTVSAQVFTGLQESTLYTVKVFGKRSGYSNGLPKTGTITTTDLTPPTISNVVRNTNAHMTWSATDTGSGMRTTNTYYTEISSKNGSTYGNGAYSTDTFRTFTTDASGLALVNGASYYMRITAFDNSNNSTATTGSIVYQSVRPNNWTSFPAMTAGQPFNLTASNWNSFCTRIQEFLTYKNKNLNDYPFTTAVQGQPATATQINQARTAIASMTTVPTAIVSGQDVKPTHLTDLQNSLNSIT